MNRDIEIAKMIKVEECKECAFKFHDIGELSARIRVKRHMRTKHTIPCEICEKNFVSASHKAVHKYLSHNLKCTYCEKVCEGYCSRHFSIETEKVGGKRMEMTKQGLTDLIGRSEDVIKKLFSSINASQVKILEQCAWYIDVGFINCNSTNWAMLLYYPSPVVTMMEMNEFTHWCVYQGLYMSALAKLTDYLNRLNYIGIKEHINKYMDFCVQFFLENDLATAATGNSNNRE